MRIAKFDRIRSHTHQAADRLDKIASRLADVPQEVEQGGNLDHFEQLEVNVDDLYAEREMMMKNADELEVVIMRILSLKYENKVRLDVAAALE